MVICIGSLATINYKPRQARKGATVVVDSGAEMWLMWVASIVILAIYALSLHSFDTSSRFFVYRIIDRNIHNNYKTHNTHNVRNARNARNFRVINLFTSFTKSLLRYCL